MSTVSRTLITPEEYLRREAVAEFKSEFYRGETFAMAGASWAHTRIKDNLAGETRTLLKGGPCQVATSEIRVKVNATGLYTYPDIVIVCDEPKFEDINIKPQSLLNPLIIVEVLSESTEGYDRGTKFSHYRSIPSLREYVLVSLDRPWVERFVRESNSWSYSEFVGLEATFDYASIKVAVPFSEIYANVGFPSPNLKALEG